MPKMRSMMRRPSIRHMARAMLTCLACACVLLGAYSEFVGGLFSKRHWGTYLFVAAASGTLTLSLTEERRTTDTRLGLNFLTDSFDGLCARFGDQRHWLPRVSRPEYNRPVASKGADVVVVLPLWTFAALFWILSLCIRAAPVKAGVCHACGYSLTGLSARARCPECNARRGEPTPERTLVSRIRLAGGRLCAAAAVVLVLAAACSEVRPTESLHDRWYEHVSHALCAGCYYYYTK